MHNKIWELIGFIPLFAFGVFCILKPFKAIKMSEGRWSLGKELDLKNNPPSKIAITFVRIFGILMCYFILSTIYDLYRSR